MNLLQMVQFVQGNVGTSADLPFAGPTTLVGITGQYVEFVNYVQQAYKAIQIENDFWRFRTRKGLLNLLQGQTIYTLAQIQSQVQDYEDIVHMHTIDGDRYGLVALTAVTPTATVTVGAVTQSNDTYFVTVANISTFSPANGNGNLVLVTDGIGNSIRGPIQSVNGKIISFAVENVTSLGAPTSIAPGSAVTYVGPLPAPNVASQTYCFFIPYQDWRGWKDRNVLPSGKATYYTQDMDDSLEFNPVPDVGYTFFFDYQTAVDVMAVSDLSTPKYMPPRYHEAICWKAVMYWASSRESGGKYQSALNEYNRIMSSMYINELPDVQFYLREYN